ncbi:MAG: putative ATPase [Saprospiraceae bacterium]|jgi:putative ATPase
MTDWKIPLAERMRPASVDEVVGQTHLLKPEQPLYRALTGKHLHSMVLWGPPGTGKTTLARITAHGADADFYTLSAVGSGVKDIRQVIEVATTNRAYDKQTVLFIDEVHRFNKSQQDTFLPHVEDGTIVLIGATTENPAFELNNALLSRARVYVLQAISALDMRQLIDRTLLHSNGLAELALQIEDEAAEALVESSDGDARRCLGFLETAADLASQDPDNTIKARHVALVVTRRMGQFDKAGDHFYDQISALHKSVRGSSVDGSLYWAARMIEGGVDPHYLMRRIVRIASEDIGNADPRALSLSIDAWQAFDRLGSPEGELAIMQAVAYLAAAPKSNAVYMAANSALAEAKSTPAAAVPEHLRNAPTQLAKSMGHGKEYRYSHNEPERFSAGQNYFPNELGEQQLYHPVDSGLEIKIAQKLARLSDLNLNAKKNNE